jgi:hypothetical protein
MQIKTFSLSLGVSFFTPLLRVKGWLWVGWVVCFGGFDGFLLLVVVGARNKLRSTLPILVLTSLKANTYFVCGFGCTLLNSTQVLFNHFLTQRGFLKTCSKIGNLLLQLGVLFDSIEKLTLERTTHLTQKG